MSSKLTSEPKFVQSFFNHLNSDRKQQHLTDFTIQREELSIPCHKLVLRARSEVFRRLPLAENQYALKANAPEEIVRAVVEFIYTLEIRIRERNVVSLVELANELELEDLKSLCDQYFVSTKVDADNCFMLYTWAEASRLDQVKRKVQSFITSVFETVSDNAGFLGLSLESLLKILKSNKLMVTDEGKVLKLATKWILAKEERIAFAADVMQNVRLALADIRFEDYLRLKQSHVFSSAEAAATLDTAMKYRTSPACRWELYSPMVRPRHGHAIQEILIVEAKVCSGTILIYLNPDSGQWVQLRYSQSHNYQDGPRSLLSCACDNTWMALDGNSNQFSLSEFIFNNNGQNGGTKFSQLLLVEQFRNTCEFNTFGASMVPVPGGMFCVGPVCWKFVLSTGTWQCLEMPKIPVISPCVFHANNKVYVLGGYINIKGRFIYQNKIQVFSLEDERWTVLDELLPSDEHALSAACYDSHIYLLMSSGSIIIFDAAAAQFEAFASLGKTGLNSASMVAYRGNLFVLCWDKKTSDFLIVDVTTKETTEFFSILDLHSFCKPCGLPGSQQTSSGWALGGFTSYHQQFGHLQERQLGESVGQCFNLLLPRLLPG